MSKRTQTKNLSQEVATCLREAASPRDGLEKLASKILIDFQSDFVYVLLWSGEAPQLVSISRADLSLSERDKFASIEQDVQRHGRKLFFGDEELELPYFSSRLHVSPKNRSLANFFHSERVLSLGAAPVYVGGGIEGLILCGFVKENFYWRKDDRSYLQLVARALADEYSKGAFHDFEVVRENVSGGIDPEAVTSYEQEESFEETVQEETEELLPEEDDELRSLANISPEEVFHHTNGEGVGEGPGESEFQKLLAYGQLILLKTDTQFRITEIIGSADKLFGYPKEQLIGREDMWERFFDPLDLRRVALRLGRMGSRVHEFGEEIRYTKKGESKPRWLLLKAAPVLDQDGKCVGWEGFGVDITDRRLVELQLRAQRQRIEALYEVSRALRVNLDPALVTLKGLNALIRATGSDAGLCCFYDENRGELEMVAAEGLSQRYLDGIAGIVDGPNLLRYTVENKRGMLLANIQEDERAARELARLEDLKATVLMPLMSGGQVLGALVIFSREASRYGREDFQLVAAAASQISFAARQAEFYTEEKVEADSLAVLYRLSHEISRLFRGSEIGEHVFSIIQQEFACKRLWFGIINNQGTHIVGNAGYGPGIRQQVKEVHVELGLRHDFLDEAIRTKKPVVVPAGKEMECSGLNRLFHKLDMGTFVILPLVSLGQVVGVIVAEPVIGSTEFVQKKLSLLMRMANEVAVVLMARRFEERVAESDKMRVATMLASGVAHNFNNLLQAVMGQASLIQMHAQEDSPIQELARTIIDSAGKGASLVKHLLSFSSPSSALRERFSLSKLLEESKDLYASLLGGGIEVRVTVLDDQLDVIGDSNLIQQAITNVVINAREAIGDENGGLVEVTGRKVRLSSGEVDPSLSPGTYARIDIKDNGKGMDEERLARCFEPFYSTKDLDQSTGLSLSGAGLGLSSAYSLAQQHGGVLSASSLRGEGTTLTLFLPLYEVEAERAKELVSFPHKIRRTALLVQPHGAAGFTIQRMFESFGLRSRLVHDLDKAKVILESPQQIVQLAVVDADYLGKSTVSFIEDLRNHSGGVSVVILTVSRDEWTSAVNASGNCIVVEKPLSMRALQRVVRDFFEEQDDQELASTLISDLSDSGSDTSSLAGRIEKVPSKENPTTEIKTEDGDELGSSAESDSSSKKKREAKTKKTKLRASAAGGS